jgi:exosortase
MVLRTTTEISLRDRVLLFWQRMGWAVSISLLTIVLYLPVIKLLVRDWLDLEDYSYCFLVPVVVGYVLHQERSRYRTVKRKPSNFGLAVMLLAIAVLILGTLGADLFIPRMSLPLLLAGIVLYVFGWGMLRAVAFPLCYLTLMIPLPGIVHNQITFPLQLLASRIAEHTIALGGMPVVREGNLLRVPFFSVEVAQACSGIRSLLSLIALGVAYVYFAERRTILRIIVVGLMLPIAIFTNAIRIVVSCLLGYRFGPEWAEGFMHLFSGWLIFVVAVVLLFGCHSLLRRATVLVGKESA